MLPPRLGQYVCQISQWNSTMAWLVYRKQNTHQRYLKNNDYLRPTSENGCVSRFNEVNASMTYVLVLSTIGIKKILDMHLLPFSKTANLCKFFLELYAVKSYHYLKCCKIFCMNTVIKPNSNKIRMLRMNI